MRPARHAAKLKPFLVMDVLEAAQKLEAAGEHVIHLEIGEPDCDTPECIKEAAVRAIREGKTHYTHSLGLLELREAICEDYATRYGVTVSPDQVIVASGTSPAMLLAFGVLLEPGDGVVISDPAYACYANFIEFVHGRTVRVRVTEDDGFQYRPEMIREKLDERIKAVVINSPANPTGTLLSDKRMQALAELEPAIVSDEIYHGLVYEGRERSILEFTDRAFVLNGFSKLYAMTGWRLGYLIAPRAFVRDIQKVSQNLFICAGSVAQWAGLAALKEAGAEVAAMRRTYDQRRRYLLSRLPGLGLSVKVAPTGAFYVLANASAYTDDSLAFAYELLEKTHVAVTPGVDFGPGAEGFIRFSYANSIENIAEGLDRLERYLAIRGRREA
jgi:aspartate/methionine/tyrosine aminotransferase